MDLNKINTVVLSGGGIKGISFIGFFKALSEFIDIDKINKFIGCSAGGIFCLSIILGYKIDDISSIMFKYNFDKFIPDIDIDELLLNYGLSDGNELKKFIIQIIEYKTEKNDITFEELYKLTNKELTLVVTNFTQLKVEYWNHINTPNNSVLDGIMATSRVPLFFKPYKIGDDFYLDGGVINNYPVNIIDNENIESFIGANLCNKKELEEIKELFADNDKYDKIIKYILNLLFLAFDKNALISKQYMDRTVMLSNKLADFLDFKIDNNIKNDMIDFSYNITKKFIIDNYDI
jgi:NTE family protein